jgi:hypothetical protein
MSLCVGAYSIGGAVATMMTGMATPDEIRTYISVYGVPVESSEIQLDRPSGSYGIDYTVSNNVRLFAEHHSSPMDCGDHPGLNMAGIKVFAPLIDGVELYGGLAIHNEGFDSNNQLNNPIFVGGAELGSDDVVVYTEYITDDFRHGQVSAGLKFYFF